MCSTTAQNEPLSGPNDQNKSFGPLRTHNALFPTYLSSGFLRLIRSSCPVCRLVSWRRATLSNFFSQCAVRPPVASKASLPRMTVSCGVLQSFSLSQQYCPAFRSQVMKCCFFPSSPFSSPEVIQLPSIFRFEHIAKNIFVLTFCNKPLEDFPLPFNLLLNCYLL